MDIIMVPLLLLMEYLIGIAEIIVVTDVILSWLTAMGILNINNRFVCSVLEIVSKISNAMLNPIRSKLSLTIEGLDFSPVVLLILLTFIEHVVKRVLLRFI